MKKVLFILSELTDGDIDWIVSMGKRQTVSDGTILIQEGHPVDTLYILLDGELAVTTIAFDGREIARLGSGEVVGEMSFVDARPPSATVTAKGDSLVFTLPRPELAVKLHQDEGFAARFYRALAAFLSNRLRSTVGQLGYTQGNSPAETDANALFSHGIDREAAEMRLDRLLARLRDS